MKFAVRSIMLILFISLFGSVCFFSCNSDSNPVNSNGDVNNQKYKATESFSYDVTAENQIQFRLIGINGNIKVTGTDTGTITIAGEKIVGSESAGDAEEHLQYLKVDVRDTGNEVFVQTIQPGETHNREYTVNYTVVVPENFKVLADNINGTVTIESINNTITVGNVNGTVKLLEIYGSASVNLTNGLIDCNIALPVDGTLDLSTVNGNIDLLIPTDTSAGISARVINGSISVSDLDMKNVQSATDYLTGTLGDGQGTISVKTVNGYIILFGYKRIKA